MDSIEYKPYQLNKDSVDILCNYIDNMRYHEKDLNRIFAKTYELSLKDDIKAFNYITEQIVNQIIDLMEANKEIKILYNNMDRYLNKQRSVYHEKTK